MTNKVQLDEQSPDRLTIVILDLLEMNNLETLEISVAAIYSNASIQQQPCSMGKNQENTRPSRVTYEYPSIIRYLKH